MKDLWTEFVEDMNSVWPAVSPIRGDEQWENLFVVWQMGATRTLEKVKAELLKECPPN